MALAGLASNPSNLPSTQRWERRIELPRIELPRIELPRCATDRLTVLDENGDGVIH